MAITKAMPKAPHLAHRLSRTIRAALHGDRGAGWLLIAAAALAMALANSPLAPFWSEFWHRPLRWQPARTLASPGDWINEGLMTLFFFTVGLEIKREALGGALAHAATRRLPVLAALAGMAVPALIYLALAHVLANDDSHLLRGWAIPAATDIAFAVGVLGLAGRGLPPSLRLFLLSVAVVDDLGAVAIITFFYAGPVAWGWLAAAAAIWVLMVYLARLGFAGGWLFAPLAMALWLFVVLSGVHASIAGVAGALAIPYTLDRHGHSLLLRMEDALTPWAGYAIVPLFALANAGVPLAALRSGDADWVVSLAVAAALVLGKPAGILGATLLSGHRSPASLPADASLAQIRGVSLLGGIGFTMSLFLTAMAFPGGSGATLADAARLGIFAGSLISAMLGWLVLRRSMID